MRPGRKTTSTVFEKQRETSVFIERARALSLAPRESTAFARQLISNTRRKPAAIRVRVIIAGLDAISVPDKRRDRENTWRDHEANRHEMSTRRA